MRGMDVLKIGVGRTGFGAMSFCLALGFTLRVAGGTEPSNTKAPGGAMSTNLVRTYTLGKKVSAFPTNEDLSTPEAAYAVFNRASARGDEAIWGRLSVERLAWYFPADAKRKEVSAAAANEWLNAEVVEVQIYRGNYAMVFARIPHAWKKIIDIRNLELVNGQWLNAGNDAVGSLEEARKLFARRCAYREAEEMQRSRPPIANPAEHLRPFVEFLEREAMEPQAFLLKSLAGHRLVILGEVHHRPRYWAFNAALVRHPEFSRLVGVIYMELPSNDQPLVDQFLAAPKVDPQPVIEMLRDNLWMGWPDQPMLDFLETVWEANQPLPKERRLRVVLVDMARPWKEIRAREDWRKYDVDRDQFMAENIARDLRERPADSRHALFIVGYMHAMANLTRPGGEPMKSAGWHLREKLGETNLCVVFPHSPVMSNMGEVKGRIALGLFETAFARLTNRAFAFPLDHGPFGEQVFDASLDHLTADPFRNGYHAYLYLGPLEDETFSPLIPGFYSDAFVQELDRRHRITFGKNLVEGEGLKKADAEGFVQWMSRSWGQPRYEWRALGPLNAWEMGSDWEKKALAGKLQDWANETNVIQEAAVRLFDAIRKADYQKPGNWRAFPAPDVDYRVYTDAPGWVRWICQHFRTNPITAVDLGEVARQSNSWPAVSYKVTLKDGSKLEGVLPLEWNARAQQWFGVEGLDWHLAYDGASKVGGSRN